MHCTFWSPAPGQLKETEKVHVGFRDEFSAHRCARGYKPGTKVEVRYLKTLEHELPINDQNFRQDQVVVSARWCPVIIS